MAKRTAKPLTRVQREHLKVQAMIERADSRIRMEATRKAQRAQGMKTAKRLTIRLPEDFHHTLYLHAVATREPMQHMAERLLREEVERAQKRKKQHGG